MSTNANNTTLASNSYTTGGGTASTEPFVFVFQPRDPGITDINYSIQKIWLNTNSNEFWCLKSFNAVQTDGVLEANWIALGGNESSILETLTGNDGIVVPPTNHNINIVGDGVFVTTSGNAATSTITISASEHLDSEFTVDAATAPGTNPVVPNASGNVTITGGQAAAGSTVNAIRTNSLAANTYTIQVQRSQAVATSTVGDNGVSHFNSTDFSVDGNGFVSILGDEAVSKVMVDANTSPGTNPVVPDSTGKITVTGGQVAAGTTANVIRTNSLAANTYTVQVQRSQAVASSTVADNGVCHFDSEDFDVDANGFVSLNSSFFQVNNQVFTTSGTYTPTTGMVYCSIQCLGGGGAGGGSPATPATSASQSCGSGGGSGEYAVGVFSAASVGASQSVTIGLEGIAAIGAIGGNGGNSSVGALITAFGGTGGGIIGPGTSIGIVGGNGGTGGAGGDYRTAGSPGGWGFGTTGPLVFSGQGASSQIGSGGSNVVNSQSSGTSALGFGSGGSGGVTFGASQPANPGGNGTAGVVVITEYIS